jgi:hypothetical protein
MAKTVNEHRTETVSRTLSGVAIHCPVGQDIIRLEVSGTQNWRSNLIRVKSNIVWWGRTLSSRMSLENVIFSQNLSISSQVWFLGYSVTNRIKLGHKGHLNTRNKFPKEVFPIYNDFNYDFGWTQKLSFRGTREIHEIDRARALDSLQGWR